MSIPRVRLVAAAVLAFASLPPVARAQTAASATSRAAASAASALPPVTLETFNVSGQRTQSYQIENVQMGAFRDVNPVDVPLTLNVLTREVLDAQAARSLFDALRNTAGVTRAQITGSAYDNLAIRGIVVENRGNYRLNGSLPIINLADTTLENKERVEVLKGTSSLYYGFIPPSGVINMVTKRPLLTPLTVFSANGNSAGAYGGSFDVSRTLGDKRKVGLRLNGASGQESQGIDRTTGNRDFFSAALDLRLTPQLIVRSDVEDLRKNVTETVSITIPAIAGVSVLPPIPANDVNLGNTWQNYKATMVNWWVRADYLINDRWTVFAETGYAHTNRDRRAGSFVFAAPQATTFNTGAGNVQTGYFPGQDFRNSNHRVETFGRILTGPIRHDLTLGYTANTRKVQSRQQGSLVGAGPAVNFNVLSPQNYYRPAGIPLVPPTGTAINPVPSQIEDRGAYVTDRLSVWEERVQVTVGLRRADYVLKTTTAGVTTTPYSDKGRINPMVAVVFKPTADTSVYASRLKGLEQSAAAPATAANAGAVLAPLTSTQTEIGAKAKVLGGLLIQVGYFEIERPTNFTDPATNIFGANGLARYRGTELFASGEITKQISLIASGQILDANQTKALNAATLNKIPEATAKYTGSLFAEWRTPFLRDFSVSAGAYYTGRRPVNNTNQVFIGGYTTHSLGASYRFKLGSVLYTARVNGDNLSDKNAWAATGANILGVTAPRLVKFSLSASF